MSQNSTPAEKIVRPRRSRRTVLQPISAADLVDEATLAGVSLQRAAVDQMDLHRLTLRQANIAHLSAIGSHLHGLVLEDVTVETADLSLGFLTEARFQRVRIEGTRLGGATFSSTWLQDVSIDDCRAENTTFSQVRAERVEFVRCNLQQARFPDTDLTNVRFRDCDLTGADFTGATLAGADLRGSRIDRLVVTTDQLRGVVVATDQALQLCGLLGLVVEDLPGSFAP